MLNEKALANCGFAEAGTVSDSGELIPHKLYHPCSGRDYEIDETNYIRVGAYGIDDLEYKFLEEGGVFLPEINEEYKSVQEAYVAQNERWITEEGLRDEVPTPK